MKTVRSVGGAVAETMAPDGTMIKVRLRISLDTLLTLAITLLAIVLAVGYQVFVRWGHRIFGEE